MGYQELREIYGGELWVGVDIYQDSGRFRNFLDFYCITTVGLIAKLMDIKYNQEQINFKKGNEEILEDLQEGWDYNLQHYNETHSFPVTNYKDFFKIVF